MTDRGNVSKDEDENNVEWPVLSVKGDFYSKMSVQNWFFNCSKGTVLRSWDFKNSLYLI